MGKSLKVVDYSETIEVYDIKVGLLYTVQVKKKNIFYFFSMISCLFSGRNSGKFLQEIHHFLQEIPVLLYEILRFCL